MLHYINANNYCLYKILKIACSFMDGKLAEIYRKICHSILSAYLSKHNLFLACWCICLAANYTPDILHFAIAKYLCMPFFREQNNTGASELVIVIMIHFLLKHTVMHLSSKASFLCEIIIHKAIF